MMKLLELTTTEDFFTPFSRRREKGVYCYRFSEFNPALSPFFLRFLAEARKNGSVISGSIENPDHRQLDYYGQMMGADCATEHKELPAALAKWLPRLEKNQREILAEALGAELKDLQAAGKTAAMRKSACVKFMCWLYYRFEQLLRKTGQDSPPKLLFEGTLGEYQLRLFTVLAKSGCDVLLLLPDGEADYRRLDPDLSRSKRLEFPNPQPFPSPFSVLKLQAANAQLQAAAQTPAKMTIPPRPGATAPQPQAAAQAPAKMTIPPRPGTTAPLPQAAAPPSFRPEPPQTAVNINTWLTGDITEDLLLPQEKRGSGTNTVYTLFARIRGAEEPSSYPSELLRLKLKLEGSGRKLLLLEGELPLPSVEEISAIRREPQRSKEALLQQLLLQLHLPANREAERHARKAFLDILMQGEDSLQRLTNRAVYVLAWLRRYLPKLFPGGTGAMPPLLLYYGACRSEAEAAFFRIFSRLPADCLLICPDLSREDLLSDPLLFDRTYPESLPLGAFPKELEDVRFGTVAYRAEQELHSLLYENSGMYRNHQFKKAIPVTIQTTLDEIGILWDVEAKYRPNFETLSDRVMVPVICAKISGVPGGNLDAYWSEIERRKGEDVFFSDRPPIFQGNRPNPMVKHAPSFLKNGKLQLRAIKAHPAYPYAFLRGDMQDYMMDKLQTLIDSRLIAGSFQNGAEYTTVSCALNLDKQLIRSLQKYDFTKEIPKLLLLNTTETLYSIEEAITIAYLNLLGFDIALYAPTGYQLAERHYTKAVFVEQQAGDYLYDLPVPDWTRIAAGSKKSFTNILFRRGN